jgi:carbon-monoxide dehydrogenase medium subunit
MKPAPFIYHRPRTVEEAVALLGQPASKVLAGGQSLVPLMNFRLSRPRHLVDINWLPGLDGVEWDPSSGRLRLGALVRHQVLATHPLVRHHLPVLSEAASHIGHWAIRSRGTLGGSLAHADPAAELPAAMVALGARFCLRGQAGERWVEAREFFQGLFTTALADDELLTAVEVTVDPAARWGFYEIARRVGDFAMAGAFVKRRNGAIGLTWFGVGPKPLTAELQEGDREAALEEILETAPGDVAVRQWAKVAALRALQRAGG